MSRPYNRRRTGWGKPWEDARPVVITGMGNPGILDLFKPKAPVPPLAPGQAPPGQDWVNRMFGATPANRIRLPFEAIDTSISFTPQGTAVLLGATGLLATGLIFSAIIRR